MYFYCYHDLVTLLVRFIAEKHEVLKQKRSASLFLF